MALGAAPVIRPLVASRYAPGSPVVVPEMLEREVMLETPATTPPISVAAYIEIAPRAGDAPSASQATMPDAATTHRIEPVAPHGGSSEVAPAVAETPLSRGRPSVDAKKLTGTEMYRVHEPVEHLPAREEMPFFGDRGNRLLPPAIIEQVEPDIVSRFVESVAARANSDRVPPVVEPPAVTGRRVQTVVDEHVRFLNPMGNDSGHHPIAVKPGVTTGDSEDAVAMSAGAPRALEASLSPRAYSELEAQESPTSRRTEAEARTSHQHGSEPMSSRPVVRITIGRVEVRAVMPPAPPVQTPVAPAPKLSLDEYLRQHSGKPR